MSSESPLDTTTMQLQKELEEAKEYQRQAEEATRKAERTKKT